MPGKWHTYKDGKCLQKLLKKKKTINDHFGICFWKGSVNKTYPKEDRLCGLVVRVSGYRYRGLGFDSRRYQIF